MKEISKNWQTFSSIDKGEYRFPKISLGLVVKWMNFLKIDTDLQRLKKKLELYSKISTVINPVVSWLKRKAFQSILAILLDPKPK